MAWGGYGGGGGLGGVVEVVMGLEPIMLPTHYG